MPPSVPSSPTSTPARRCRRSSWTPPAIASSRSSTSSAATRRAASPAAATKTCFPFPGLPIEFPEELQGALGASLESVALHRFPDLAAGIVLTIPLGHRAAHADIATAESAARQIAAARERIRIQIALEVRNAAAALETAGQRIEAARAARAAAEIQLRAEEDRLSAGATTPFFVLTRQNELAAAEVADATATAAYRRALTELARARGTLLRDRAIDWRTTP